MNGDTAQSLVPPPSTLVSDDPPWLDHIPQVATFQVLFTNPQPQLSPLFLLPTEIFKELVKLSAKALPTKLQTKLGSPFLVNSRKLLEVCKLMHSMFNPLIKWDPVSIFETKIVGTFRQSLSYGASGGWQMLFQLYRNGTFTSFTLRWKTNVQNLFRSPTDKTGQFGSWRWEPVSPDQYVFEKGNPTFL